MNEAVFEFNVPMISQNKSCTGGTGILVNRTFNSEANRKDLVSDGILLPSILYSAYQFINTVEFSLSLRATVLSLFILFGRMEFKKSHTQLSKAFLPTFGCVTSSAGVKLDSETA